MTSNDGIPLGFRQVNVLPPDLTIPKKVDMPISFSLDLIATYMVFRDMVYNPVSVLYPSCGFDGSPARAFNQVTFVDKEGGNEGCIQKMQDLGLRAFKQDIQAYLPNQLHDLLILLNPAIPSEWATRHVISGGYIISNDYHGNATELYRNESEFLLLGTLQMQSTHPKNSKSAEYSTNLEDLFDPVMNEAELEQFRPNYYEFLKQHFSVMGGGEVDSDPNRSFEKVWAEFRIQLDQGMPSKRVADLYVFLKK